jgi:bacterioferritin
LRQEKHVTTAPFLRDLTRVRSRARKHSAEGAADGAGRRDTIVHLLNDILAGELIWLMRYRRSYLLLGGRAEISEQHRSDAPTPADRLARRIVELGGEPDLDPDHLLSKSRADYASRGSVSDRIREDLRAEHIVIESYGEVIGYLGDADSTTREMLEANLSRENARVAQLSQILRDLEMQTLEEAS